ncbi:hypothetical protein BWI97_08660 [Siphonobacter sp. BAB-5405]|nr:hypothetical protein BWI97_08660 [Siphonobacter sp. BAB-5405]
MARREVVDLRGRLQGCEIENNNLENSLRTSQGKELALTNSLMESHQETEKERKEKRAARWEVWLWRLGTAGIVVWKISTAFR